MAISSSTYCSFTLSNSGTLSLSSRPGSSAQKTPANFGSRSHSSMAGCDVRNTARPLECCRAHQRTTQSFGTLSPACTHQSQFLAITFCFRVKRPFSQQRNASSVPFRANSLVQVLLSARNTWRGALDGERVHDRVRRDPVGQFGNPARRSGPAGDHRRRPVFAVGENREQSLAASLSMPTVRKSSTKSRSILERSFNGFWWAMPLLRPMASRRAPHVSPPLRQSSSTSPGPTRSPQ